ncbi:phage tail protein [Agarilytica rhodophyticola]|uniref:phage tail protein n=1 Tax=Agarilytica rhodophyticola TaxID=1737490 RepID=UPI000B340F62|nr:phage tail protein [Agarilytica rhodophyticola]
MNNRLQRDIDARTRRLNQLARNQVPRAMSSALNKSVKRLQTQVVRSVSKSKKLPAKVVRKKTFISRATPRKTRARLYSYPRKVAVISLLKTATILKNVRRGTNRKGVRAAGRQFDGAFINVHRKSGKFQVFKREGKKRYPIDVVGIEIKDRFSRAQDILSKRIMKRDYPRLLSQELNFRIERANGRT